VAFTAIIGVSLYYIGQACGATYFKDLPSIYGNFGADGLGDVVFYGALSNASNVNHDIGGLFVDTLKNPATYAIVFSLIFVNLFDTTATLMSVAKDTNLMDERGRFVNNKPIVVDASGALICGPLGTSTITSFVESTVGVRVGARTGLASVMSGLLFILSAFIFPVFSIFTSSCVTAPALVCVGALIFTSNLKELNWKDITITFTCFITILMIVLTYSLTNGIGVGLLVYLIMMLASGHHKEINWLLYVIGAFFVTSIILNVVLTKV
jgi:AGZA family xanthine/uracil permease-like MFS transporter